MLSKIRNQKLFYLYLIWFVLVFLIVFLKDGITPDNITHFLILVYFILSLALFPAIKSVAEKSSFGPRTMFVGISVFSAIVVESFYMISKPLHSSLLITTSTPFNQAIQKWAIDIMLTAPFYVFLFLIIWFIINKFDYSQNQYLFFVSLGQALGDGSAFFLLNPALLLLLPYVLINYHAMSFVPFKLVKEKIKPENKSFLKFLIPILIVIVYFLGSAAIFTAAGLLKLF